MSHVHQTVFEASVNNQQCTTSINQIERVINLTEELVNLDMCGDSQQACRLFRSLKHSFLLVLGKGGLLTDALRANLAVTIRALAGEGTQCVDALLAGLTVVLISLALVNIWTGR